MTKIKSVFLLFIFLFFKIGVAHSLSHSFSHDNLDNCEQCILIVDANKTQTFDYAKSSYNNEPAKEFYTSKTITLSYKNPFVRKNHLFFFFNKPPPTL
ncbi:hypothetical protein BTO18_12780 [Polaribacter porphyrae]|uniref:Uncharacterized protein n=1 Tax=Polaribacter porphyrae TaxID=1137780 RepID=A0A2S7WRQ3_9FLAO|nr:hypothetical protein BTO18_12780 [Polaribacter porphyrae]